MIRMVLTDCDGVLTNGQVWVDSDGKESVAFSRIDGEGVRLLRENGIQCYFITGEPKSVMLSERFRKLGIQGSYGIKNKLEEGTIYVEREQLGWNEVAIIGDDLNDSSLMSYAESKGAHVFCPPGSVLSKLTQFRQTHHTGGNGAFRDVVSYVLERNKRR